MGDYGLFFSAPWCSGCRKMYPIIDNLIKEGYNIRYVKFDVEKRLVKENKIEYIPTLIIKTVKGEEVKRWVGQITSDEIRKVLKK